MPTANELILDAIVRHQIGLHRLGTQTVREVSAVLGARDSEIIRVLKSISGDTSLSAVEAYLRTIERVNKQAYDTVQAALVTAMLALAEYEVQFQGKIIADVLPEDILVKISLVSLPSGFFRDKVATHPIDGAKISEYIAGAAVGRYNRIRDTIRREHSKGGSSVTGAILAGVIGTTIARHADGVLSLSLRSLDQITRTIQSGIVSAAKDLWYRENDHIFSGILWSSSLDTKTSPICQRLDGRVFPLTKGSRPPAHRVCRSTFAPIMKSWRALGLFGLSSELREFLDGGVPEKLTYNKWLARQSAAVQDEVLGPTRGRMYRSGQVSIDRFVDEKGRRYTLDQLRVREGL